MKRAVSPHILLLSAVVLAGFTGCTKTGQPGGTVVEIRAAVDGTAVETKAASPLPGGSSFGIFAFKNAGTKQLLLKFAKYTIVG